MEWLTLGLFCAALLVCVALKASVFYALTAGLALFLLYGRRKGFGWGALARMALDGVKTVHNILLTFLLIGILTALWRAAGTIPALVCYAAALIRPAAFLLMTFLLNCGISVLTGTSFGTAATMGVICATMGRALGVDLRLIGGAVLSGAFFGDRCSPVSTSALLVAELTGTDIFDNLRRMLRSALAPFLLTCGAYAALGLLTAREGEIMDLRPLFERAFVLRWPALIPAAVILVLSALRVRVKVAMTASILAAIPLCLWLQGMPPGALPGTMLLGYRAADAEVGAMLNGGGVAAMLRVAGIVCLSASYSGIFRRTGLLDGAKRAVTRLAGRATPFAAILATSVFGGMVACNQTLTVMLVDQLCRSLRDSASDFAVDIEDSAVVVAPLVPWSIAGAVPLAAIGAPAGALPLAFYLYLLPLWRLAGSWRERRAIRPARRL